MTTTGIIKLTERALQTNDAGVWRWHLDQLLAALKAARAENEGLREHLPILDSDCPSCECGGQLCTEHGTGIDRR